METQIITQEYFKDLRKLEQDGKTDKSELIKHLRSILKRDPKLRFRLKRNFGTWDKTDVPNSELWKDIKRHLEYYRGVDMGALEQEAFPCMVICSLLATFDMDYGNMRFEAKLKEMYKNSTETATRKIDQFLTNDEFDVQAFASLCKRIKNGYGINKINYYQLYKDIAKWENATGIVQKRWIRTVIDIQENNNDIKYKPNEVADKIASCMIRHAGTTEAYRMKNAIGTSLDGADLMQYLSFRKCISGTAIPWKDLQHWEHEAYAICGVIYQNIKMPQEDGTVLFEKKLANLYHVSTDSGKKTIEFIFNEKEYDDSIFPRWYAHICAEMNRKVGMRGINYGNLLCNTKYWNGARENWAAEMFKKNLHEKETISSRNA